MKAEGSDGIPLVGLMQLAAKISTIIQAMVFIMVLLVVTLWSSYRGGVRLGRPCPLSCCALVCWASYCIFFQVGRIDEDWKKSEDVAALFLWRMPLYTDALSL